jgi:hypothetical protein
LYTFLISPMRATGPPPHHQHWFDHSNNVGKAYKLWSCSLYRLLRPRVTSSLFKYKYSPQHRTLFSDTLDLSSCLNVRDQISQPYETTGKIIVLYILMFKFLEWKREDKRLWTEWYQSPSPPPTSLFWYSKNNGRSVDQKATASKGDRAEYCQPPNVGTQYRKGPCNGGTMTLII